jgi:hypothetical protein
MVYLADSRGPAPELPPPARAVPIEGYGNLIIVTACSSRLQHGSQHRIDLTADRR